MGRFTKKQRRFCIEYVVDHNATKAAIRAGYSEKTARSIGSENLTKPDIKQYIENIEAEITSEKIADATEVMIYLTSVMRRQAVEHLAITVPEEKPVNHKDNNGMHRGQYIQTRRWEIIEIPSRLCNANKAAELIGKRLGMWDKKADDLENKKFVIIDPYEGQYEHGVL